MSESSNQFNKERLYQKISLIPQYFQQVSAVCKKFVLYIVCLFLRAKFNQSTHVQVNDLVRVLRVV